MEPLNFVYINSISKENIATLEDVLRNKRLTKYLWLEFILNPQIAKIGKLYIDKTIIKNSLTTALSWYLAFRWLFPENKVLEELQKKKTITPYRINYNLYKQERRSFLKGILHAQLC